MVSYTHCQRYTLTHRTNAAYIPAMLQSRRHIFQSAYSQLTQQERAFVDATVDAIIRELKDSRQPLAMAAHCDPPQSVIDADTRGFLDRQLVCAAVTERLAEIAREHTHGPERWLNEVSAIAFSNIDDYIVQDSFGNLDIDWNNCPREAKAAVREFTVEQPNSDGMTRGGNKRKVTFKCHDKIAALKMYGEYVGALQPDNPHRVAYLTMLQQNNIHLPADATSQQVADAYAALLENGNG